MVSFRGILNWVDESRETDDTLREALFAMINHLERLDRTVQEQESRIGSLSYDLDEAKRKLEDLEEQERYR